MSKNENLNENPNQKPKNDNFFNKNPLITFIIFSVGIILIFKSATENSNLFKINFLKLLRTNQLHIL